MGSTENSPCSGVGISSTLSSERAHSASYILNNGGIFRWVMASLLLKIVLTVCMLALLCNREKYDTKQMNVQILDHRW